MQFLAKWLDMPPVWLLGAIALSYIAQLSGCLATGVAVLKPIGAVLVMVGVLVMVLAIWQFSRAKTSVIPRETPSAFLQNGPYRLSRNPIYVADAIILTGVICWWDVLPMLFLVPVFGWVITQRFIIGEEQGLLMEFGAEFDAWAAKTRRWL